MLSNNCSLTFIRLRHLSFSRNFICNMSIPVLFLFYIINGFIFIILSINLLVPVGGQPLMNKNVVISSMKVKNYTLWMNSYKKLTVSEYNTYLNIRSIENIIYFQEIDEYMNAEQSAMRIKGRENNVDNYRTKDKVHAHDKKTPQNSNLDVEMETVYEMHFINDLQKYAAYQAYSMNKNCSSTSSGSRYLVGANERGFIQLDSFSDKTFQIIYTVGWPLFSGLLSIRPGDAVVISSFRTTSFDRWVKFMTTEQHVIERWSRLGLLHMFAGVINDKLGQTVLQVSIFDSRTPIPSTTSIARSYAALNANNDLKIMHTNAVDFNTWYKDLINNGLSRMYKSNLRSFALAPCHSNVYVVTHSGYNNARGDDYAAMECEANSKIKHCTMSHTLPWLSDMEYIYY